MPIYEYWCNECKQRLEDFRPIRRRLIPAECPDCGKPSNMVGSVGSFVMDPAVSVTPLRKGK